MNIYWYFNYDNVIYLNPSFAEGSIWSPTQFHCKTRKALLGTWRCYKNICFFGSIFLEMARFLSLNDPETLLQLMEEINSDFSDDDFDSFIDENEKKMMIVF